MSGNPDLRWTLPVIRPLRYAAYRAGIGARNRWLVNSEVPWVKGGLAVAKRHALHAAYRGWRATAKKMSKGAFQGDWGSPLEVWMRRFDRCLRYRGGSAALR